MRTVLHYWIMANNFNLPHFNVQARRRCHVDQRIQAKQIDLAAHQIGHARLRYAKAFCRF